MGMGLGELAVGPPEQRVWEGGGGREGPRHQHGAGNGRPQPRRLKNPTGCKQPVHLPGVCFLGPQLPEGRNEALVICGLQTQMLPL